MERVRRCCSKTCVHQNRSAKLFNIGSKTPTSRGNWARQSACSTDDASALSDVSKEQHNDGKCIFQKVSVGIVAKHDDSVIGDEDGTALSGHRQEDPSNRFLLSVGPSPASDATVWNMLSLRPLWQRNLMFTAQTPMQRCFRLGCRTRTTCIHSGRLGPTDIRSPWMPWITVMFDCTSTCIEQPISR